MRVVIIIITTITIIIIMIVLPFKKVDRLKMSEITAEVNKVVAEYKQIV